MAPPLNFLYWAALGILLVLYGSVVLRELAGRGEVVPFLFLGAAVALVLLGVISPQAAQAAVNLPILAVLFSMFVFAASLDRAGAMMHLANWLASKAGKPEDLVFLLFVGFGLMSMVLVNDALAVLMVPLLLHLARRLHLRPLPLLLTLAYGVTVGSALTPIGNPQNLLIALYVPIGEPIAVYLRYLFLPVLGSLLLGGLLLRRWFRPILVEPGATFDRTQVPVVPLFPRGRWRQRLYHHPSLVVFPLTMCAVGAVSVGRSLGYVGFQGFGIDVVVASGAALLLLLKPGRVSVLSHVDWSTLLLFVGLFIVMAAEVSAGVVASMTGQLPLASRPTSGGISATGVGVIMLASVIGSQIFSNVPWVALSLPAMVGLGYSSATPIPWMALAAGSTLAGNITLLGAASNLIIVQQANKAGVQVRLLEFAKYGAPLAAISLLVTFACLALHL